MKITLYSRVSCAPCATLKYWLNKKGYNFEVVEAPDGMMAPTIKIGEQVLTMPDVWTVARLLEAQKTA